MDARAVAVKLLSFRSGEHFSWFITAMIVFLATCFISFYGDIAGRKDIIVSIQSGFCGAYALMALLAAIVTKGGRRNDSVFSVDCIWFNLLVSALYIILVLSTR